MIARERAISYGQHNGFPLRRTFAWRSPLFSTSSEVNPAKCGVRIFRTGDVAVRSVDVDQSVLAFANMEGSASLGIVSSRPAVGLFSVESGGSVEIRSPGEVSTIADGEVWLCHFQGSLVAEARTVSGLAVLTFPESELRKKLRTLKARLPWASSPQRHFRLGNETDALSARLIVDRLRWSTLGLDPGCTRIQQIRRSTDLIRTLLTHSLADLAEPEAESEANSAPWYVTIAERYLRGAKANPVSMKELAAIAGVSPRTLHDGFQRSRGYSPMTFLRLQRMEAIHGELLDPNPLTTVTQVAMKWGVNHLGRFSIAYSKQYGQSPSDTLRLARSLRDATRQVGPARSEPVLCSGS